jgi:predicted MPP superfamily phosphohydrolase
LSQFLNRRNFLKAALATGALAIAAESAILEPNHPRLVRIEVPLSRLPEAWDGIRIAQMSDFHYDEHFSVIPIRKAIDIVNGLDADLVVLTGDFVTVPLFKKYLGGSRIAARFIEPCANLLAQVMLDAECWLFWGIMMPVPIRTGSPKLYRRRASRFYGTAPFHSRKVNSDFG